MLVERLPCYKVGDTEKLNGAHKKLRRHDGTVLSAYLPPPTERIKAVQSSSHKVSVTFTIVYLRDLGTSLERGRIEE